MDILSDDLVIHGHPVAVENVDDSRREFSELLILIVSETCDRYTSGECWLTSLRFNDGDASYRLDLESTAGEEKAHCVESVLVNAFRLLFPGVLIVPLVKRVDGEEWLNPSDLSVN